jgi:glycosyltransferase involved in cell wall biosynthesis
LNILHITPTYAPAWAFGGVVRAVSGLAEAQAAAGHHVVVLTTDALDRSRRIPILEQTLRGVHITRTRNLCPALRGRLNLSTPLGFTATARRLVREHSIEVLHCHELRTVENLLATGAAVPVEIPRVISPHGTIPYATGRRWAKRIWDRMFGRRLARRMAQVIALTDTEAAEVRALCSELGATLTEDQVSIVANGVEPVSAIDADARTAFRRRWGLGDDPVVIYLGRLAARKRLPLLVAAFAQAVRAGPKARLLVAGPDEGVLDSLRSQVRDLGLQEKVTFTGMLDGEERFIALQASDVFALPATGEGASIAALEALACGLPVVLTEGSNFPEVALAGAGVVVPATVEALAGACRSLIDDGTSRARMGQRGRELIESHYTWPKVAPRVEAVYQAVLRRTRQSRKPNLGAP